MGKTQLTKDLEMQIWKATHKQGVFGCFEVTIGWFGQERVDYMTFNTKGIWRFYEIKVSKEDFHSKAHKTFLGHYNYFVMPKELFEQVQQEIPEGIGVYVGGGEARCVRQAKKRELAVDEKTLVGSMIRSLSREAERIFNEGDVPRTARIKAENERLKREASKNYNDSIEKQRLVYSVRRFLESIGLVEKWEAWRKLEGY